ncbi:MAG: divalent-cation tolerance protein CutA [Acidobacteria bacterium]|nr:divalent-cation tolerance protein CutA [Acidobacteriota bacterium]
MTDKRIVLTTCGSEADAERIARALVERRLAACVNIIGGVRSIYRWKDAVEDDAELLLIIKTQTSAIERLKAAITELHPYDVPELVVVAIEDGASAYLDWIGASVS